MAALDPSAFLTHQDYLHATMTVRQRLYRLEQELESLEAGNWVRDMGIVSEGDMKLYSILS